MMFHIQIAETHEEVLRYLPVSGIIGLILWWEMFFIFFNETIPLLPTQRKKNKKRVFILKKRIAYFFVLFISRVFWEWGFTWGVAFFVSLVEWIDLILSTMAMENLPLSVGVGGSGVRPSRPLLDLNFPPGEEAHTDRDRDAHPAGEANPQNPGIDREPPQQERREAEER